MGHFAEHHAHIHRTVGLLLSLSTKPPDSSKPVELSQVVQPRDCSRDLALSEIQSQFYKEVLRASQGTLSFQCSSFCGDSRTLRSCLGVQMDGVLGGSCQLLYATRRFALIRLERSVVSKAYLRGLCVPEKVKGLACRRLLSGRRQ